LLLLATGVALGCANSSWADAYLRFWHAPLGIRVGPIAFERTLEWVVNDGLMAIFFFVVGLEIRHQIQFGELSKWRHAALPAAAALGGMLAPAALYLLVASSPEARTGWAIPMATDIAFALGVTALLGRRVPPALRVLLLALAVLDDLGAIVVITFAYSSSLSAAGLLLALLGLGAIFCLQLCGVRKKLVYVAAGITVWAGVYTAGVHPTIAGVLVGLLTPTRAWLGRDGFVSSVRHELQQLSKGPEVPAHELSKSLRRVDSARREALSPAESLIETLHPWVDFVIMPLFALANAGVTVSGGSDAKAATAVTLAVAVGLLLGKPAGILLACWLSVRLKIGVLPAGIGARHLVVLGVVAGIGFTMSLFISQLAFGDPALLAAAKLGVLTASGGAALCGLVLGRLLLPAGRRTELVKPTAEALSQAVDGRSKL
jgi:NhaA family Na+:H+ antiporter